MMEDGRWKMDGLEEVGKGDLTGIGTGTGKGASGAINEVELLDS